MSEHNTQKFPLLDLIIVLLIFLCVVVLSYALQVNASQQQRANRLQDIQQEVTRRATCMSNVKQLMTAIRMYSQDHDGHVQLAENGYDAQDISNDLTRAFYLPNIYGLVNNPAGGIGAFAASATIPDRVTIGGEPCTRPLLLAAASVWHTRAKATIIQGDFSGQYAGEQHCACYLHGTGDGMKPAGNAVAIARNAVVIITAKQTQIPESLLSGELNGICVVDANDVRHLFGAGCQQNAFQTYTFPPSSGTRRYFSAHFAAQGQPLQFGANTKTVKDDEDMVRKVAGDPYGIGYCSAVFADPHRVDKLALKWTDGQTYSYPQQVAKYCWNYPNLTSIWPLTRTLYAEYGGRAWTAAGTGIVNIMLTPRAPGTLALQNEPMFQACYWAPGRDR